MNSTARRISGEEIAILAAEALQQQPLDLVFPHKYDENDESLQSICQIGEVPDVRRRALNQPRHYLHGPIYTHYNKQLQV